MTARRPAVVGIAGTSLEADERALFAELRPAGVILFARNCDTPDQIRRLIRDIREELGEGTPVLIDQEGGRVARLQPPTWPALPPLAQIGALAPQDREAGLAMAGLHARLIGGMLAPLGIDVDCAPVLDVPVLGAHAVIGDRAFADDPHLVAALGSAYCAGLISAGITPVIKHLPGHGRAQADSHTALPVVDAAAEDMTQSDWVPFATVCDAPFGGLLWGMTAHIRYPALDPQAPATCSDSIISGVIRGRIGFEGLLISDDIGMAALEGSLASRAVAAQEAGCELILHCSGEWTETQEVLRALPELGEAVAAKLAQCRAAPSDGALAAGSDLWDAERARLNAALGLA